MSKTKIIIMNGRLGKDAEVKKVGDGTVINFSVATTETWTDKKTSEKKEDTTWTNCEWWADATKLDKLIKAMTKGSSVNVEGVLKTDTYKKGDVEVTAFKCKVDEVQLLSSKEAAK